METGIHRSSVFRIIGLSDKKCVKKRRAQTLTTANCISRLARAKQFLRKFPQSAVDFIFFSDENFFLLHLSTYKMTASTQLRESRNATFLPRGSFVCDQCSVRSWWCKLQYRSLVALNWFSWSLAWKWMTLTTVMCYCPSPCFLLSVSWRETCTCSSRTVCWPTEPNQQSSSCIMKCQISFQWTCGRRVSLTWILWIIRSGVARRSEFKRSQLMTWLN